MEITHREKVCQHLLLYLIKYVHNDLISDLHFFCIPGAIFNARAFKYEWYKCSTVDSVTFDISSFFFVTFMDL